MMSWTSAAATQNGNTTVTWTIGPHGSLSTHDAVVIRHDAGNSGIRLHHITVRASPLVYQANVEVVGAGAVAFRFAAEQMD
jgi:hypothetical protein